MSLKAVFQSRFERAARVLECPESGPKTITFSSEDLADSNQLADIHDKFPRRINGVFYLYQLSIVSDEETIPSRARAAFRRVNASGTWNMSRDNKDHQDCKSLYVGTSESMYERFRTHLGRGNGTQTWALYLSKWAVPLKATFLVEYYAFKETIAEDVELIEGVLWDSLRPLFGKKGGK